MSTDLCALVLRYQSGDRAAGGEVLRRHERLVNTFVRRYRGKGLDDEDLAQWGRIGVLDAADRYDPARGEFVPCAMHWIRHRVIRALENEGSAIRLASKVHRDLWREGEHGEDLVRVRRLIYTVPLDTPIGDGRTLAETVAVAGDPETSLRDAEQEASARTRISDAMDVLTPMQRDVVQRHCLADEPERFVDIGARWDLCRERMRQVEKTALKRMRRTLVTLDA